MDPMTADPWGGLGVAAFGLVMLCLGLASWFGRWRGWVTQSMASPRRFPAFMTGGGAAFLLMGLGITALPAAPLAVIGLVILVPSCALLFVPSRMVPVPKWYEELPERTRHPLDDAHYRMSDDFPLRPLAPADLERGERTGGATLIDENAPPRSNMGSGTTMYQGRLHMSSAALVFVERRLLLPQTNGLRIPLDRITDVSVRPHSLREYFQATDYRGMGALRRRLEVRTPERSCLFVVHHPNAWVAAITSLLARTDCS